MTEHTIRDIIQVRLALAERDEESPILGVTLRLRELTRAAFKDVARWAASEDLAERERLHGAQLAGAVQEALGQEPLDTVAFRQALTAYYLGTPERATDPDRWNAAILAASWIDPATGRSVVTREEILAWPARADLRDEVLRLAQAALDLSEVGQAHLKSGGPAPITE
jgi:hypothetical protein